jgi:perosamine synthetase
VNSHHAPIPLSRPAVGERELDMLRAVLESGWLAGQGPRGRELAAVVAETTGRKHGVVTSSCTAGLHLALIALDVQQGDEVLVADYTFPATAMAVAHAGASPVLVDVSPSTGAIDLEAAAAAVTPRTKALIAVDPFGLPADWTEVEAFCADHGLRSIADAACSMGSTYRGESAGRFGDIAVFSLHARKGVTGGEGGVLVTNDEKLALEVSSLAAFGMAQDPGDDGLGRTVVPFTTIGYNYKLDELSAAVALAQMERLAVNVATRAAAAEHYFELLDGVPRITVPVVPEDRTHAWQTFAVTVSEEVNRDEVIRSLRAQRIGCTIGTYAVSALGLFSTPPEACPASNMLFRRQVALPMFVGITQEQQARVVDRLRNLPELAGT